MTPEHEHDWRRGPLVAFEVNSSGEPLVDAVCVSCWVVSRLPWATEVPAWTEADYTEHAVEVERRFGPMLDAALQTITDAASREWQATGQ